MSEPGGASGPPAPSSPSQKPDRPEVTVRAGRIEDIEAIVGLLADDGLGRGRDGGDLAPYAAALARMVADRNQIQAVAELGGQVVGTMQFTIIHGLSRRGTTRAQIEGVRTLSTLRGRGIGEQLFAWAFETARAKGATLVQLTSDTSRGNAHRFYERLGFVASHTGFKKEL